MKAAKLSYRTNAYVSDFERYLGRYLDQHPNVEPDQRRGLQQGDWHKRDRA